MQMIAYDPADATAIMSSLASLKFPDWFNLSGAGLPWLSWKTGVFFSVTSDGAGSPDNCSRFSQVQMH